MPELEDIHYSRNKTIAAIHDYYTFLAKMYLPDESIMVPPEAGWPSIAGADESIIDQLGKTPEVIALLARLPYLREDIYKSEAAPECFFADWRQDFQDLAEGKTNADSIKAITEGPDLYEEAPSPVFGLTACAYGPLFVLDTELGIVHWSDCSGEIKDDLSIESVDVVDELFDGRYQENDWRHHEASWAITDFFEVLKEQFRQLNYIPISPYTVTSASVQRGPGKAGLIPMLREIYQEHGWPDLQQYRKKDCLEAVQRALEERYPDEVDYRRNH
ncbi:hypothetical protein NUW58_g2207 [Xylaria curta]|uniref:Uncharacterized protein n=2 Tax=Xylaria curta TaxID=42375 RepID=A0ACC1PFN3_9PEZI|nr:hypothetical protein NUW58_g2427 [Xylaria curta]KAJ2992321.1 hypothetical protein NUW58_g2207 [Xylaria curta]